MGHCRKSHSKPFRDTGISDLVTLATESSHLWVAAPPLDVFMQLHGGKKYRKILF